MKTVGEVPILAEGAARSRSGTSACARVRWGVGSPSLAGGPRTPLSRDPPVPWKSSGPGPHLPGTQERTFLPARWRKLAAKSAFIFKGVEEGPGEISPGV